jgi:flagellar motor component MotA
MSEQQGSDLRKFLIGAAQKARSEGIWALEDDPDQPEFFKSLLKIWIEQCNLGRAERDQGAIMLKALVLISEGNQIDLVEEIMTKVPCWGDFFHYGLHDASQLDRYK